MNKKEFNQAVGNRLRGFRHNVGLSQWEVAKKAEMEQPAISELERGEREIKLWEFYQICDAIEIDPRWITDNLF